MNKNKKYVLVMFAVIAFMMSGCTDAGMVSWNTSRDADNFKVLRKITFINTVSDEVLYTVEGNFSINENTETNQLEIIAKTGDDKYQKHFLGLSPTTVYIVEQTEWKEASKYNFKVNIKPSAVIPDIEMNRNRRAFFEN